ncbi:glycosyltransferase family 4 protein [Xenorhabdus sp. PB61.4]|uniref:MraY family glycosyltransferase n=1 Tax=Xenorhabdus sp. PB61.4 TaxID=2788940 RepID=UPI001E347D13|nr:glycosyltransferase family 4 protein [Xenorhabdus sp. PB61.4]MCC8365025.1 glycosyltransferase family 4 protein [Xenorhabdus sp. PB61.4]
MSFIVTLLAAFIIAYILTWLLRGYAIRNNVFDIPVHRSSHSTPTPRGGGIAIVITLLTFMSIGYFSLLISRDVMLALAIPGLITAVIGFLDDHGHIDARLRLLFHFLAAGSGLYFIGGFPTIVVAGYSINIPVVSIIFGMLFLVWMLNLYNFMDGINGIAGIEAVSFGALSLLVISLSNPALLDQDLSLCLLILAGASLGFLVWNFPAARIFMGDAGSGFLGIVIGLLLLIASQADHRLFFAELILLGVFVIDSTVTLLRRVAHRHKPFEAHASHCYQILSRHYQSHTKVTTGVIAINVLWLTPLSFAAAASYLDGVLALIIAWVPLIVLAWKYGAGVKDKI